VHPVIDSRFAFEDTRSAWERFASRNLFRTVAITQDA
jgi:hypothetical protein